ncbi:MAG: hypothetical protein JXA90_17040 [Planctomycetes bacterium]|nr:hypothetical protein [Planctomycetota bacterium]
MEALIKAYEDKNVFFFHTLGGDEYRPNVHFKKHYRLTYPVISDNLDRYRHIIRVSGITNVAVFGGDGACVFNEEVMGDRFQSVLDAEIAKLEGPNLKKAAFVDGSTVYAPAVKKEGRIVRERMPSLAAGPSGELHLAYVTDAGETDDVYLRACQRGKWGKPVKVAATRADEYAPSVVALGRGVALVAYVSDAGGRYDIFTALVKGGRVGKAVRVTQSADDAMAPVLCAGEQGTAWLAWYEWARMGPLSRDREIFVSRLSGSGWSKPLRVSPPNVPTYEDHADPAIYPDRKGGIWVAWAWDYHGTLTREKPPVEENSIFMRSVDRSLALGPILAAGFRGEGRARDYAPTLAVALDGTPWVAWDNSHKASRGYGAKALFVNQLAGADFGDQQEAAAHDGQIDSPRLIVHPQGTLCLVWEQETRAGWELWLRKIEKGTFSEAVKLSVKSPSPRFATACFDTAGTLWVAYTHMDDKKWTVTVEAAGK